jgi:uncharacterized protein
LELEERLIAAVRAAATNRIAYVCYSGGIDSTLVLAACVRAELPTVALLGISASLASSEREDAHRIAREIGAAVEEVATNEIESTGYRANAGDRCYYCKAELWERLGEVARTRGFDAIIDGTNADDLTEHRPGLRAADEHGVRSPLAELGWSKAEVRTAAHALGLPGWDAPASPCLSSRVVYGLGITPGRLRQVEQGEAYLRSLGVAGDLRVRHHGDRARIEVSPDQFERVREHWDAVRACFVGLGFAEVELDPAGYRRGALLALAPR